MSKKSLMAAAIQRLKADSIESYALIDVMLNNAGGSANLNYVEEIAAHAKNIYTCECAARKIQELWGPKAQPPTKAPPKQTTMPPPALASMTAGAPKVVTTEHSLPAKPALTSNKTPKEKKSE